MGREHLTSRLWLLVLSASFLPHRICAPHVTSTSHNMYFACKFGRSATDAVSYNVQCSPPGVTRQCIPGCMGVAGQWAPGSYRGAKGLEQMLGEYEFADAGTYNEVRKNCTTL